MYRNVSRSRLLMNMSLSTVSYILVGGSHHVKCNNSVPSWGFGYYHFQTHVPVHVELNRQIFHNIPAFWPQFCLFLMILHSLKKCTGVSHLLKRCQKFRGKILENRPANHAKWGMIFDSISIMRWNRLQDQSYFVSLPLPYCWHLYCYRQAHNDLHPRHDRLDIREYLKSARSRETRFCPTHKDEPLTLGCSNCLKIAWVKCITAMDPCMKVMISSAWFELEGLPKLKLCTGSVIGYLTLALHLVWSIDWEQLQYRQKGSNLI